MDELSDRSSYASAAQRRVATALARACMAGEASPPAMRARAERVLGHPTPWLVPLALHLHFECAPPAGEVWHPRQHDQVVAAILAFPAFLAAFEQPEGAPGVRAYYPFHQPMGHPPEPLAGLLLPSLATIGDLADWLEMTPSLLDWYADAAAWSVRSRVEKRDHYHSRWVAKAAGGARLIEAPKENLRFIQRRILREILNRVPVHEAAQGCVRGRSVVDNARRHLGSALLLKLDLRDFFVGISGARVHALFRTLGYPRETARYLTGLTTRCSPAWLLRQVPQEAYPSPEERCRRRDWARQFMGRHLPQGAPTSPALANLCAYRLDLRLAGAARECQAGYSRYVDDLVFSCADGDLARGRRIVSMVQEIILEEGFSPNWRKTRLAPACASQRITGLVVNERLNLPRAEYDTLKAILTNCRRHGPASQNHRGLPDFASHLRGRLSWFRQVNPERGACLQALFDAVPWEHDRPDDSVPGLAR